MKIEKLHIENYKSIKNIDLNLNGNFNILIGKNTVGKSNVIDALLFLSEIALNQNIVNVLTSRGGYQEVVFGKDVQNEIILSLEIRLSEEDKNFLFSNLSLQDISFEEFKNNISDIIRYKIKLSFPEQLIQDVLYIYFKEQEILYSGNIRDEKTGMHSLKIIKSFADGYKKGDWNLVSIGGRSPPYSLLYSITRYGQITPEMKLLLMVSDYFELFRKLNPVRESPEIANIRGDYRLNPDAKNLPQLLNTLASSNREIFDRIVQSVKDIIDEIIEIRVPLREGSQEVYLSIKEHPFDRTEFMWKNVSSGTKEIIYLLTLLHSTPKGSLLVIEEPGSHLHGDAISKFMSLIDEISVEDDKQFILTTHSTILIDNVPYENLFVVIKNAGKTEIVALKEFSKVDEIMAQAGVPASWILMTHTPSFVFLISGRDDFEIWTQFFIKNGMNPKEQKISIVSCGDGNGGGFERLIVAGKLFEKLDCLFPS